MATHESGMLYRASGSSSILESSYQVKFNYRLASYTFLNPQSLMVACLIVHHLPWKVEVQVQLHGSPKHLSWQVQL